MLQSWRTDAERRCGRPARLAVGNDTLVIVASAANFTLRINVASWFKAANGSLIDPNDKTNVQCPQVATNVKNSFSLYRDEQRHGHNDDQ